MKIPKTPRASAYLPPIVRYGDQPMTPEVEEKLRALILNILASPRRAKSQDVDAPASREEETNL